MNLRDLIPPPAFLLACTGLAVALTQVDPGKAIDPGNLSAGETPNSIQRADANAPSDPEPLSISIESLETEDLSAILDRPLFRDTRRPAEPILEAVKPAPVVTVAAKPEVQPARTEPRPEEPAISYLGRKELDGQEAVLVRDQGSGEEVWANRGFQTSGWTLTTINHSALTFEQGPHVFTVPFAQ